MMFSGFNADYEASSSRCSSASPAGDSLSYYHSPADSFSSMGSPVNTQVSLALCSRRVRAGGRRGGDTWGVTFRDLGRWGGLPCSLRRETGEVRAALTWEPRTWVSVCTLVIVRLRDPLPARRVYSEWPALFSRRLVSEISLGQQVSSKASLTRAWEAANGGSPPSRGSLELGGGRRVLRAGV